MDRLYKISTNVEKYVPCFILICLFFLLYRADKKQRQKTLKRVKIGIHKRLAMKHAIFSRRKIKNKKKKT